MAESKPPSRGKPPPGGGPRSRDDPPTDFASGPAGGLDAEIRSPGTGRGADGAPAAFEVCGRVYLVKGVSDWWPGRRSEHYKVRTSCGAHFLLHHNLDTGRWTAGWLGTTDA